MMIYKLCAFFLTSVSKNESISYVIAHDMSRKKIEDFFFLEKKNLIFSFFGSVLYFYNFSLPFSLFNIFSLLNHPSSGTSPRYFFFYVWGCICVCVLRVFSRCMTFPRDFGFGKFQTGSSILHGPVALNDRSLLHYPCQSNTTLSLTLHIPNNNHTSILFLPYPSRKRKVQKKKDEKPETTGRDE